MCGGFTGEFEMKSFIVGEVDNDYNVMIGKFIINSCDRGLLNTWCEDNSWSGHSYVVIDEIDDFLCNTPKVELIE